MKNSMGLRSWFGALAAAALVVGCGGGGGTSSSGPLVTSSSDQARPGVYDTRLTFSGGSTVEALSLLSSRGNYVTVASESPLDVTFGQFAFLGSQVQGTATNYFQVPPGIWNSNSGTVSGTAKDGVMNLTASSGGSSSSIRMTREDGVSNLGFDLSVLEGVYTATSGGYTLELDLNPDGTLTGSDTNGCLFEGALEVPDDRFNVFEVPSFTATTCSGTNTIPVGAVFEGLGTYDYANNTLIFYANDGEAGLLVEVIKT